MPKKSPPRTANPRTSVAENFRSFMTMTIFPLASLLPFGSCEVAIRRPNPRNPGRYEVVVGRGMNISGQFRNISLLGETGAFPANSYAGAHHAGPSIAVAGNETGKQDSPYSSRYSVILATAAGAHGFEYGPVDGCPDRSDRAISKAEYAHAGMWRGECQFVRSKGSGVGARR